MANQPASPSTSPLEKALIAMDQHRLRPSEFYQVLLATEIFVPTVVRDDMGEDEVEYVTEVPESYTLIVLDVDERMVVPMFDDFDRFQQWVNESGSTVGYIGINAETLLSIMDPELSIAFFAGEEGFYLFDQETLGNLKDPEVEMLEEPPAEPFDDPIMLVVPDTVPDGLVDALATVLQSHGGDVVEARMVTLSGSRAGSADGPDPGARLTVGMTLREDSDELFNEVAAKLAKVATSMLPPGEIIHFLNLTGTELGDSLTETLPPFFAWPQGTIH